MEKVLIFFLRRHLLLRRLNSLLCTLTFISSIFILGFTAYYESLSDLLLLSLENVRRLIAVPALYLLTETMLLTIYRCAIQQENKKGLSRFSVNRRRLIVLDGKYANGPDSSGIMIGNLSSFLSLRENYIDIETLVESKLTGIVIGLLNIALIIGATLSFDDDMWLMGSMTILITSVILLVSKIGKEELKN